MPCTGSTSWAALVGRGYKGDAKRELAMATGLVTLEALTAVVARKL